MSPVPIKVRKKEEKEGNNIKKERKNVGDEGRKGRICPGVVRK